MHQSDRSRTKSQRRWWTGALALAMAGTVAVVVPAGAATKTTKAKATKAPSKTTKVATTATTVAATAAPTTAAATTPPKGDTPKTGGTLTLLHQLDAPRGFDPARASYGVIDAQYQIMVYDSLLYIKQDGTILPGIASSVTPTAGLNFTQWVIKLRPGVKFTDGTDFNVDAILAHWDRVRNPANASSSRSGVLEVDAAKTKAIDPLTLQVTLTQGDSTWNQTLATGLGTIPSPTAVKAVGEANYGTNPQAIVGAGPFKITELVRADHYTFERNPGYWDSPKPYLQKVIIKPVTDADTRGNTFKSGAADVTLFYTPTQQLIDLRNAKYSTAGSNNASVPALALRTDTGPTADVRVREALQRALDIDSIISRSAPGAVKAETLMNPDGPWANTVKYPEFDRAKAQSLIDAVLKDTGQSSVKVKLIGANSTQAVWEAMKQDWDKIKGLEVTLQIEDSAGTSVRIATGNFNDMLNTAVPVTPRTALPVFTIGSPQNVMRLKDSALDTAIGDANATIDPVAQRRAMEVVAKRLAETVPYVLQYRSTFFWFWQKNVKGIDQVDITAMIRLQDVWKD